MTRKKSRTGCRLRPTPFVIWAEHHQALTEQAMTIFADTAAGSNEAISKFARWTGRALSGVVILFLLLDGGMKLLPLQIVTETMDKMGWGASDNLARSLGLITIVCTVLYAVPPTSILGAILLTGYLGGAIASHVRIDSPLFSHALFGLYLGLMVWGGLWLRDTTLRSLLPFRR
jgi:DoxX-like family